MYYCGLISPGFFSSYANADLAKMGYDVVTMDLDVDRKTGREAVGDLASLQGNYDPRNLIAGAGKSPWTVRQTAKEMLQELGPQRLIANLGEGLGGKECPTFVNAFVEAIHSESAAIIAAEQEPAQEAEAEQEVNN